MQDGEAGEEATSIRGDCHAEVTWGKSGRGLFETQQELGVGWAQEPQANGGPGGVLVGTVGMGRASSLCRPRCAQEL